LSTGRRDSATLAGLCVVGALAELFIIFVVVRPLSLVAVRSPIDSYDPIVSLLGTTTEGIWRFAVVATAAILIYLAAYVVATQCRHRWALPAATGFSALFSITLLLSYPNSSPDIFNYIIDGRMAWLHGLNPMAMPRTAASFDPLYNAQHCCAQFSSPYGPTWQWLLVLPTKLAGDGFVSNTIAFRAISVPFLVGCAYLAARIAQNRAPRYAAAAVILVGWSPLILWEIAVNGHNDMVMTAFALFAVERADRKHWSAALPLLTASVLAKYVSLILAPLVILAALVVDGRRAVRPLIIGGLASLVAAVVLTAPFWGGPSMFSQILGGQLDRFAWSPGWLAATILHGNTPLPSTDNVSSTPAGQTAKLLGTLAFAAAYCVILYRLWRRKDDLVTASVYCFFFYLCFAAWSFWPWYVCTLLAFAGGLAPSRPAKLALLFSVTALYSRIILAWSPVWFSPATSIAQPITGVVFIFGPPLAYWAAGLPRPRWLIPAFGQPAYD
jgi:hypothetical protein